MKKIKYVFLLTLLFTLFFSFTVQAENYGDISSGGNGAGGDSGGTGTMKIVGGPKSTHTGWLVYLIDADQKQVSATRVYYSSAERPGNNYIFYPKTRFGGSTNNYVSNGTVPWTPAAPFGPNGEAYGAQVKSYILQENNLPYFIDQNFNLEYFTTNECYLVMEPFFWGQIYNGKTATGRYLCATAYGWADMQETNHLGEYGSAYINRYTNNTYPNCVKLEYPQFGRIPLSGKLTNKQIMDGGYNCFQVQVQRYL